MNSPQQEPQDESRRPTLRRYLIWALILMLIPGVIVFRTKSGNSPTVVPVLVPLGTNQVKVGMRFYDPHGKRPRGEAIEVNNAYEFPDETIRPGVLVRGPHGFYGWIPRTNMNKLLVPVE